MYLILIDGDINLTLTGESLVPESLPLEIKPGWNWISYPVSQPLSLGTALNHITPMEGDIIKGQNAFATFNHGSWQGNLTTMEPGKGYIYLSNRTESFTFVFPTLDK